MHSPRGETQKKTSLDFIAHGAARIAAEMETIQCVCTGWNFDTRKLRYHSNYNIVRRRNIMNCCSHNLSQCWYGFPSAVICNAILSCFEVNLCALLIS